MAENITSEEWEKICDITVVERCKAPWGDPEETLCLVRNGLGSWGIHVEYADRVEEEDYDGIEVDEVDWCVNEEVARRSFRREHFTTQQCDICDRTEDVEKMTVYAMANARIPEGAYRHLCRVCNADPWKLPAGIRVGAAL